VGHAMNVVGLEDLRGIQVVLAQVLFEQFLAEQDASSGVLRS